MPNILSADICRTISSISEEVIAPLAAEIDEEGRWPREGIRALQEAGLAGLTLPRDVGGLGYSMSGLVETCEIIGAACTSTALCFGMHLVGAAVIAAKATDYQKEAYLVPIAKGEHLTTLALSEPGSGAHFYFPLSELCTGGGGGYAVHGAKSFVTNGGYADSYVVSTVANSAERPVGEFSLIVLREGAEGMTWGDPWRGLGMRGNASRNLNLSDVPVAREDLLGNEGDQVWYMFNVVVPYFLTAMSGTYLGVADAAVDETRDHLSRRSYSHSGQRLSEATLLQHRLGTMWATVERTRRLVYYAAMEGERESEQSIPALMSAKAEVAECAVSVVNDAMTLAGGIAYGENGRLGRLLRDARAAHVMAPTTDLLRIWTGRALLGQPILSD